MENNKASQEIVIENVAHLDNFYVYTQQRTSYNGGVDFEVTAEWKHLRNDHSLKMAIEWSSSPTTRIPFTEQIPDGCGKIELNAVPEDGGRA
jgi:hypothetical protein